MLSRLLKLLYPPRCVFCGGIIHIDKVPEICDKCRDKLPQIKRGPGIRRSDRFESLNVLYPYEGIVKESITRFKFHDKPSYFRTYAALLKDRISENIDFDTIDAIASVPLHSSKKLSRGYNQAQLISRRLAYLMKKPDLSKLLVRIKKTESQSKLEGENRKTNVRGAFEVRHPDRLTGMTILLVDDILTTGSTINECCRVLKAAGVPAIHAAVIASGRFSFSEQVKID